uniref:4a-hydroxytetrahydrobiopterin dehydratase n=1 Tax=Polytomella parva TaxID=51329 RepID=A0A7S0VBU7_9CHLO|mmetsp:Transcript_32414/g.58877  ORF Transcript_32414/g.58877 Transcript_32414/m.58877 type:complete len:165 (+) Transcript_32414:1-495(+)
MIRSVACRSHIKSIYPTSPHIFHNSFRIPSRKIVCMSENVCHPCLAKNSSSKLDSNEATRLLSEKYKDWKLSSEGTAIKKSFKTKNFVEAISYFNKVCEIAEKQGHHPDLHLKNYQEVEVVISTHAVQGLTLADFNLAGELDNIAVSYSKKWLKEREALEGPSI